MVREPVPVGRKKNTGTQKILDLARVQHKAYIPLDQLHIDCLYKTDIIASHFVICIRVDHPKILQKSEKI